MAGSQTAPWNGNTYNIPALGDTGWSGTLGVDGLLISLAANAVTLTTTQNVSGKTFTSCTYSGTFNLNISTITNGSATLTLPTTTDTLLGRDTTDTLTHKTISSSTNTIAIGTVTITGSLPTANGGLGGNFGASTGALSVAAGTVTAGTLSIGNGGTGVTSVTSAPAATAFAGWDANKNLSGNNFIESYSTTATAAGTTALSVSSAFQQFFTGSSTQTVTLPDCTTLALGQTYLVVNRSTGAVTVNNNGGSLVQYMGPNSWVNLVCTNIASANGAWTSTYQSFIRQVAVGTAQTSDGTLTNVAFTDFSNQPTLTFTANFTGKYRIYCNAILSESSTSAISTIRINNSAGGASVSFSQESQFNKTASTSYAAPVYMIASLTAGTSYTFTLQGKTSTGTLTLVNSGPTNGIAIVAEQIE